MAKTKQRICPKCKGTGKIYHPGMPAALFGPAVAPWESRCDRCGGTGRQAK